MTHPFDDMKAYVGFTDADAARLEALWPLVEPHVDRIVHRFVERALASPSAARVLEPSGRIHQVGRVLRRWLEDLHRGPYDPGYYIRHRKAGQVHQEVGLPAMYVFTAMSVVRDELRAIALVELDADEAQATEQALLRITSLDLAVMMDGFTEAREREELSTLQELIVSNLPATVLVVDEAGTVTAATQHSTRLFGERDILGLPYTDALPGSLVHGADLPRHVQRALETGREITLMRVDVQLRGRDRTFRLTVVPLDHPLASVLLHIEDLTATVETEARLRRTEALAQLGSLSAAVAHELRNPLAGISGAIQVIARSLDEDDFRREIMRKVEHNILRLNALVTDLLAFSKPVAARMGEVDLAEVVRGVCELVGRENPEVDLRLVGAGVAWADANLVHHILLNVVQNAVSAVDHEGRVLVLVQPARVVVADDGAGVPDEIRDRVFTPFFTTRARGTGLGLTICRKLAAEMQARIHLTEGPLPGAAFALQLLPVVGPEGEPSAG